MQPPELSFRPFNTLRMAGCIVCDSAHMTRSCNYCGETVCTKHRLPKKHDCAQQANVANHLGPTLNAETVREIDQGERSVGRWLVVALVVLALVVVGVVVATGTPL